MHYGKPILRGSLTQFQEGTVLRTCFVSFLALFYATFLMGQNTGLTQNQIKSIVEKSGELFSKNYVFPTKGDAVALALNTSLGKGFYKNITHLDSLVMQLKRDISKTLSDKHVNFIVKPDKTKVSQENQEDPMLQFFKSLENFGLTRVEEIEDGIGLLEINFFFPIQMDEKSKEAASKAMNSFKDCHSLIFDLRNCRGGNPEMLNYLVTYLYPEKSKIHLNDFYFRPADSTESTYTLDEVPGQRLPDIDVFVLTSGKTFSCGEEFAYDIKHLKRGQIIGEVTGGAAHPVQPYDVSERLQLLLPTGRAINPITKSNWESVGVKPHVQVAADNALEKALKIIHQNQN
ncbi:S41 family peptidase [Flagellimonas flava]|uniref:N-terminal domain of Peptidase_S41 n=1 Tax=Flagellimonas flava TaxID=570519 RepID=A0A1M5JYW9_9FLAO|nr:S41 family peptidase [Allomuricauda flava]SHG45575.1 N-terminal domain of Peptidase_S41 [Allomuricauda flava]